MQVFVPSSDFDEIARVLDNKRLFKQGVEAFQLVGGLTRKLLVTRRDMGTRVTRSGKTVKWINDLPKPEWYAVPREAERTWGDHKVGQMWAGHIGFLAQYQHVLMAEWRRRGYNETVDAKLTRLAELAGVDLEDVTPPAWWGDERVHGSHRRALKFKMPEHYSEIWPDEPAVYNYWWPLDHAS